MKAQRRAIRYLLAAVMSAGALAATAAGSAAGQVTRDDSGTAILGGLDAVDAGRGGQVWSVGFRGVEPYETLAQRWDGTRWVAFATPAPTGDSELLEVATIGRLDAWAVGYSTGSNGESALVLHWDGQHWARVPSHVPGGEGVESQLYDVDASSPSDVWAVGTVTVSSGSSRTLTMHWDGDQWRRIPSANMSGQTNVLLAVAAQSADDAWAVGYGPDRHPVRPGLAEHWDGTRWSVVPLKAPAGSGSVTLNAVAADSARQVWAVGRVDQGGAGSTLTERWNGREWSIVPAPSPQGNGGSFLTGVTTTTGDAWTVGEAGTSTFALHNVGNGWHRVHTPSFPPASLFTAVTAVSADDIWAVGFHGLDQERIRLLSEHWDGTHWVALQY